MNEVDSLPDLVAVLQSSFATCIGIEGFCGSGKSYLAKRLAQVLKVPALDTDDFVKIKDSDLYYPEILDLDKLVEALKGNEAKKNQTIMAGICLRDVAQRINVRLQPIVYVKKVAPSGLWHDLLHLEDFERNGGRSKFVKEPHTSDLKYHMQRRPHERADIVLVRREEESDA